MSVNPAGTAAAEGDGAEGIVAFSATAIEMASVARRIALRYFRHPLTIEHKIDDSPVTIADRDLKAVVRESPENESEMFTQSVAEEIMHLREAALRLVESQGGLARPNPRGPKYSRERAQEFRFLLFFALSLDFPNP